MPARQPRLPCSAKSLRSFRSSPCPSDRRALEADETAGVLDLAQMAQAVAQAHAAHRVQQAHLAHGPDRHAAAIEVWLSERGEKLVGGAPHLFHIAAKVG